MTEQQAQDRQPERSLDAIAKDVATAKVTGNWDTVTISEIIRLGLYKMGVPDADIFKPQPVKEETGIQPTWDPDYVADH